MANSSPQINTSLTPSDKEWEDKDIENVLSTVAPDMSTEKQSFSYESFKTNRTLKIFGKTIVIPPNATPDNINLKDRVETILKNFFNSIKDSNLVFGSDQLPTDIRLVIPLSWIDPHNIVHFSPLCLHIELDTQKLADLIKDFQNFDTFQQCIIKTNAQLIESTITSDLTKDPSRKLIIEKELNAVLKGTSTTDFTIEARTPFLQRGEHPDEGNVDCGPITAEQGLLFLNGQPPLKVTEKYRGSDFPEDFAHWNENTRPWESPNDEKRKAYAKASYNLGLQIRLRHKPTSGPILIPAPASATASATTAPTTTCAKPIPAAQPSKDELAARTAAEKTFNTFIDKHKYSVENNTIKDTKGAVVYTRSDKSAKDYTVTTEKPTVDTAYLMALDLRMNGFTTATITTSEANKKLFQEAFEKAGFKEDKIKFKLSDPTVEDKLSGINAIANMGRKW